MMSRTLLACALVVASGAAYSQTTAAGPYYATPSWDQTMPAAIRIIVLSNFNNEAFLDRETGLVWRRTLVQGYSYGVTEIKCLGTTVGGRLGFRLPTASELGTLGDAGNTTVFPQGLAVGLPFLSVPAFQQRQLGFWSSTVPINGSTLRDVLFLILNDAGALSDITIGLDDVGDQSRYGLCVRAPGGIGAD